MRFMSSSESSDSEEYIPEEPSPMESGRRTRGVEPKRPESSPLVPDGTFQLKGRHKLLRINGADKNSNGDLVFNVELKGVEGTVFVSNAEMKKHFVQALISWYEKYVVIGTSAIAIGPYDPNQI